ncbi:MAG: pyridoxal-phosphate dependent enzyme [Gammaproteobacteria bacterium]|nr:pyridoxal-phosphate dependent enzyme [Gammaproteobacteria bacterium]
MWVTEMDRPLYNTYPEIKENLPYIPLAELPTPVTPAIGLANELGLDELWIKCDDVSAPDYGGNKIRKLEFLLAAALEQKCTTVITYGGMGSNHAIATAINCRRQGLECIAILTPEPVTDTVRRTLQYHQLLGTRLELARYGAELLGTADRLKQEIGVDLCYEIPFGGSSWVGATGFVNAALELKEQIDAGSLPCPDVIYLACGTAGSVSGLALGLALAQLDIAIEAVRVTPESLDLQKLFESLFTETNTELGERAKGIPVCDAALASVRLRNDQLGDGYAMPTDAAREAARLMAEHADMGASLTYTAKAMAGLMSDAGCGRLAGKRALFWNTYNSRPYPGFDGELNVAALLQDFQPFFRR